MKTERVELPDNHYFLHKEGPGWGLCHRGSFVRMANLRELQLIKEIHERDESIRNPEDKLKTVQADYSALIP